MNSEWSPLEPETTHLGSVTSFGVELQVGDRVRLWPQKTADIMDIRTQGQARNFWKQSSVTLKTRYTLLSCWKTMLRGSRLVIEGVDVVVHCPSCHGERPAKDFTFLLCSDCGTAAIEWSAARNSRSAAWRSQHDHAGHSGSPAQHSERKRSRRALVA